MDKLFCLLAANALMVSGGPHSVEKLNVIELVSTRKMKYIRTAVLFGKQRKWPPNFIVILLSMLIYLYL